MQDALVAISKDLDGLGDAVVDLAGQIEAVQVEVEDTRDDMRRAHLAINGKLDALHDLIRDRLIPRLNEIDELRGKVGRVESDVQRAGLHLVGGE